MNAKFFFQRINLNLKIKAWMFYLVGIPLTAGLGFYTETSIPIFGYYLFYGLIVLGVYYLTHTIWIDKKKVKEINK